MPAVFRIVSRVSGKALTSPPDDGAEIKQMTVDQQDNDQMWMLMPQNGAIPPDQRVFRIQSFLAPDPNTGLVIGVNRQNVPPGQPAAPLALQPVVDGELWTIAPAPPYYYLLGVVDTDLLMDVPDSSGDDGKNIQVYPFTGHDNQQWTFLPVFEQL